MVPLVFLFLTLITAQSHFRLQEGSVLPLTIDVCDIVAQNLRAVCRERFAAPVSPPYMTFRIAYQRGPLHPENPLIIALLQSMDISITQSNATLVLMLEKLSPGQYEFRLTATDWRGEPEHSHAVFVIEIVTPSRPETGFAMFEEMAHTPFRVLRVYALVVAAMMTAVFRVIYITAKVVIVYAQWTCDHMDMMQSRTTNITEPSDVVIALYRLASLNVSHYPLKTPQRTLATYFADNDMQWPVDFLHTLIFLCDCIR
jgi:hypothetical protein